MAWVMVPASTAERGTERLAGWESATVAVPMTVVSDVLVAVTVTVQGAG